MSTPSTPTTSAPAQPVGIGRIIDRTAAPVSRGLPRVVEFRGVAKTYNVGGPKEFTAIRNVNFFVEDLPEKGEFICVLGPSGCGKSTILRLIAGLPPQHPPTEGEVLVLGQPVTRPGADRGMVFQDYTSFDHRTVLENITFGLECRGVRRAEREELGRRWIEHVGLDVANDARKYPHELSGGMRQPDEPTTALDVTIQAQILDLLRELKDRINSSIMLITHDLGVIAEMADYVVVMYAGRIVEKGTAQEIYEQPSHPYTIGLMASKPSPNKRVKRLYSIPGKVPNPINMPDYCYFRDRCEKRFGPCYGPYPHEIKLSPTHSVNCYLYDDQMGGQQNG